MGGSPTLPNDANVSDNPAMQTPEQKAKLDTSYARLKAQGMSDQGITAPEQIMPALKSLGHDLKEGFQKKFAPTSSPTPSGTPNSYNRETSNSLAAIDHGLDATNKVKNPNQADVDESIKKAKAMDRLLNSQETLQQSMDRARRIDAERYSTNIPSWK
jgi:hypothetical protein